MICKFCQLENATSRVTPDSWSSSTCMASSPGYYDEQGQFVRGRDPNWYTQGYTCSRGHRFSVMQREGEPDKVTLVSTLTISGDTPNG